LATLDELTEAYAEWRDRSNANPRLTKMAKGWDRVIHFRTTDNGLAFTMRVENQRLSDLDTSPVDQWDVAVTGTSEDFCDMFWGDLNPSEKYMSGEITLQGSQEDVMRIDAISMVAFLDT
jgi:putative sterol carrier protein